MRFASGQFLWGTAFALLLAGILIAQGVLLARARSRFGNDAQILALLSAKSGIRRGISATLVCLAVALAFVAAAQPQYGKGTRILPATNLDVVLVLDYSKSMYARDISPSRIERAKVEVVNLVRELSGARFGAVAFAGDSIAFPLTSDGAAIAQFFRGLNPNDMAVGGTAIARALASAQNLLERDPLSKNHERVLVLITDGEDLEGDPVQVAREAASSGIRVEVVQIGGQTPEPIPEIDEQGKMVGLRRDETGNIMTTELSADGEAQLLQVASEGQGELVRASAGQTGIDEMTTRLRRLMTEELSERVETVYADVFQYPLALAVVLLMLEVFIGTAPKRALVPDPPRGSRPRKKRRIVERATISLLLFSNLGCEQVHPLVDDAFLRESPEVNAAIDAINAKDGEKAEEILTEYLETGPCEEGVLGVGDRARELENASFDLALALSLLAEGQPPEKQQTGASPAPTAPSLSAPQGEQELDDTMLSRIGCALRLLSPLSLNADLPAELRARSHYLAGNLEMLRTDYEAAIESFDAALRLAPGLPEGEGDEIGAKIAKNRALSLRLLQEQKEQEEQQKQDQDQQEEGDSEGEDGENEPEEDQQDPDEQDEQDQKEQDDSEGSDEEKEQQNQQDGSDEEEDQQDQQESNDTDKKEEPQQGEQEQPSPSASQPPPQPDNGPKQSASRDERMLDLLEQAPTLQQHDAQKRKADGILGRPTMEDK